MTMIKLIRPKLSALVVGALLAGCSLDKGGPTTPAIPAPTGTITLGGSFTGTFTSAPIIVVCDDTTASSCSLLVFISASAPVIVARFTSAGATTASSCSRLVFISASAPVIVARVTFAGAPPTGTFTAGDAQANADIYVT